MANSYPNDFNCPISLKLLRNPVICDDGITYERESIENWFKEPASRSPFDADKRISPMTKKLISMHLIPNLALKNSIEDYFRNNTDALQQLDDDDFRVPDFQPMVVDQQQPVAPVVAAAAVQQHFQDRLEIKCTGIVTSPDGKQTDLHLSLVPPNHGTKRHTVYINVVDVSGSMQLAAMNEQTEGDFEYSRLDLVKYSMENIVENCTENDYFALVIFSNNAEIVMPITRMNVDGKALAKRKIYEQDTQGCTNLWGGILKGLELAKEDICRDKNVSMIVLTDGEANQNPPRGVYATLESYLERSPVSCSINTLGFGYDIDSQLLFDIALKIGGGTFCFIPDCTMIGTNVTSLIAKNKTCFAKSVELKLAIEGASWIPNYDDLLNLDTSLFVKTPTTHKDATTVLNFGPLDYGQQRDIVIRLNDAVNNAKVKAMVSYNVCSAVKEEEKEIVLREVQQQDQDAINEIHDRSVFIKGLIGLTRIRGTGENENSKLKKIKNCEEEMLRKFKQSNNEKFIREFETIKFEREGQVSKAVERPDWFKKWGLAHILYLVSSHLRRFNSNFKDPSIQSYGGDIFETNRSDCETLFCTLQQPKPSIRTQGRGGAANYANRATTAAPVSIAQTCCNIDAGCFTGDSEILMKNGTLRKVEELEPGDELQSWNGETCRIRCILKTKCLKAINVVRLNGLTITPYHPVYANDKWQFPIDLNKTESVNCGAVYNLVVDREHVVIINGVKCVTLGHGYTDQVVSHPYFGSEKVINDLKEMKGWKDGYITVDYMLTTRDESSGLINGMMPAEYIDCSCEKSMINYKQEIVLF